VLHVSALREHIGQPATIERLAQAPLIVYDAESANDDPIRRQLADRARAHGLRLQPKVEVELKDIAAIGRELGPRAHAAKIERLCLLRI
jgi:hypothetical protein